MNNLGIIQKVGGDDSYLVEDSLGYMEKIWREDIIKEDDHDDSTIQVILSMKDEILAYAVNIH